MWAWSKICACADTPSKNSWLHPCHLWGECGENKEIAGPQEVPAAIFLQVLFCLHHYPISGESVERTRKQLDLRRYLPPFFPHQFLSLANNYSHFGWSLEDNSSQSIFVAVCELLHVCVLVIDLMSLGVTN